MWLLWAFRVSDGGHQNPLRCRGVVLLGHTAGDRSVGGGVGTAFSHDVVLGFIHCFFLVVVGAFGGLGASQAAAVIP